ncbi:hypothetical protein C8R43DRAFT_1155413 [Mycena crocata]|nr:hypothetical protein C8R43DRAFT_1155413 [Mycena crocata]
MKRGFLNSSKAQARPLGPLQAPKRSIAINPEFGRFPIGKVEPVVVPEGHESKTVYKERDARSGSHPTAMTYTTLPIGAEDDEPVTECFFFPGSKEVLMNIPGFPQPMVRPKTSAFRVAATKDMGMGLFSTRALKMGDLILTERPLLVSARGISIPIPKGFTSEQMAQHTLNELERVYTVCLSRMRPEKKKAFMALANSHKEDGSGPIVGIVRTNALCIEGLCPDMKGELSNCGGILEYISRLNHSCSPNTQPRFDKASFSYGLYAVRDIAAGDELTFQYGDIWCAAEKRNAALKPYAFTCTCEACMDAPASDARRTAITDFTPTVFAWVMDRTLSKNWLIDKCLDQLALIEREGLEFTLRYFDATKAMMEVYICLGETKKASEWAAKAVKYTWHSEKEEIENIKKYLDPASAAYKKHMMWQARLEGGRPNSMGKMIQDLAALATKTGSVKTLPGGQGMMMFPGPSDPAQAKAFEAKFQASMKQMGVEFGPWQPL